jgi:type I restriction enzyme S subunit
MTETMQLGDVVTIERGTTYKSALLGQPGPVLLGLGTIHRHGGFRSDSLRTYGGESPEKLLVRPGQLYASLKDVTQTADLLGAVAMVPAGGPTGRLTQDTVRLDLKSSAVDVEYLYWILRTPQYREYCRSHATGTTTMGLPRDDFFAFEFPAPTTPRRVLVDLLRAFDDKIAANTKTVRILLELADAHFARAVREAKLGHQSFADVADISGGGTPRTSTEEYWGGDICWATPTDVTALAAPYLMRTSRTITAEGLSACASALYPAGSILMTSRATVGAFAIAQVPTAVNQGFIVVNAKDTRNQWWLFHEMKSRVPEFLSYANGATFLELPRGRFKDLRVRLAGEDATAGFGALVGPIHAATAKIVKESQRLAATRDELLPLLMSGKVRVKDAEKSVEGVL